MEGFSDFTAFAEAETPRLLRVAFALTGNPHDAWDLTQEALVRVGTRWSRLKDESPGGYARVVLVRLNVDRVRRARRELVGRRTQDVPVEVDTHLDEDLVRALDVLTHQQRAAVVLRCVVDLDHAAIADHLGCSEGTARSHLSRGLARMREALSTEVTT